MGPRGRSPAPSNLLALFWRGANTGGTASRPRVDDSERVVLTGRGGTGRLGAPSERRRRVAGGKYAAFECTLGYRLQSLLEIWSNYKQAHSCKHRGSQWIEW